MGWPFNEVMRTVRSMPPRYRIVHLDAQPKERSWQTASSLPQYTGTRSTSTLKAPEELRHQLIHGLRYQPYLILLEQADQALAIYQLDGRNAIAVRFLLCF